MASDPTPTPELIGAVRAACHTIYPDCTYPSAACDRYCQGFLAPIRAALAELAEPSEEMVAAAAFGMAAANICRSIWRAMMRHILGGKP